MEEESLHVLAPEFAQRVDVLLGLGALGDDLHVERAGEAEHR